MTVASVDEQIGSAADAARDGGMHICMFVYNNCSNDARVLKEAASLTAAGHRVEIVAVLDKKTVPAETRGAFEIVRIDRNPPHYKLLRATRQVRRRLRLRRARMRRFLQARRKRAARRLQRMRRPPRAGTASRSELVARRQLPAALRPLVAVIGAPLVLYRALRWRVLHRFPRLRPVYYRTRARLQRGPSRRRAMRRLRRERAELTGAAPPRRDRLVHAVSERLAALRRRSGGIGAVGAWLDRTVSRVAYKTVMRLHKPLMFTDYYRRAYRLVRDRDFDAFHAHDLNTIPVAWAAARRAKVPWVYDSHELYTEVSTLSKLESRVWRFVEKRLAKRATRVITVCQSIAGELVARYHVREPVILLNCPPRSDVPANIDRSDRLRARAEVPEGEPIVLYQGGYAPFRGLPELIDSARYYQRGVLVLMGWGPIEEDLARHVRDAGLEERVRMIGPAERHELLSFTCGADIGVIPYQPVGLNNYYTTPNKLFEYIAAGLPVLGSSVPELKRFVEGYGLGLTFDPYDVQDIASAVNFALSDDDALTAMRDRAVAAGKELVWEREEIKLLEVYERDVRPALHHRRG